jgi:Cu-processing system ATP-binding protein
MSHIEICNLGKTFGKRTVLQEINVTIKSGEVTAIMGPNGSGKSTLMKAILGLVIPDVGEIQINNKDIISDWAYRKDIGYMPQIANYPENISVIELIRMIKDVRQQSGDADRFITLFRLENHLNKKLKELSGGMRQKVNAILAFMFDTSILIFDEPTVGLDPISRLLFKELLLEEKQKGKTILLITHHMNEIEELADNIIFILEGKVFFQGTLDTIKLEQEEESLEKAAAKILENNNLFN